MTLVETFSGQVLASPKSVYRKLLAEMEQDKVKVVSKDDEARTLYVGGRWWFNGRWSVEPDGEGSLVRLEVWCKRGRLTRMLAHFPIQAALKQLRAGWDDDMRTLSQAAE